MDAMAQERSTVMVWGFETVSNEELYQLQKTVAEEIDWRQRMHDLANESGYIAKRQSDGWYVFGKGCEDLVLERLDDDCLEDELRYLQSRQKRKQWAVEAAEEFGIDAETVQLVVDKAKRCPDGGPEVYIRQAILADLELQLDKSHLVSELCELIEEGVI
jgi:hypothetical protein